MAIHIRRREFIAYLGSGALAWPLEVSAQQPDRGRRIGVLMGYAETDTDAQAWYAAFREGLQKLGWKEGHDTQIDTRWATPADVESMRRFAKELVALQPDLILSSTTPTTTALLQQTRTIPIVFAIVADPVGSGFVASLARPGGNITGFIFIRSFSGRLSGRENPASLMPGGSHPQGPQAHCLPTPSPRSSRNSPTEASTAPVR
jgi:putative ABC transport system substrate-binding protein